MGTPTDLVSSLNLPRAPWDHQAEEWAASEHMPERLLAFSPGTGKTTTATVWLRLKYRARGEVLKTLVIAPLGTLSSWKEDFVRNAPPHVSSQVAIAAGVGRKKMSGQERMKVIDKNAIILTNYESLTMPNVVEALKAAAFRAIVLDEIHRIKNPTSKRFKALLSFSDTAEFRLGLTGTLVLNSFMDVWAPLRFVDKGKTFGTNFYSHFRDKYFFDKNAGMRGRGNYFPNWQPKDANIGKDIGDKMRAIASSKTKEECLTLPPRVVVRVDVPLSLEQERLYLEMQEELVAEVNKVEATASNALVKLLRMRQILSGFFAGTYAEDPTTEVVRALENPRMDALEELLTDITPSGKVVVWSTFRANYPLLRELANKMGIAYAEYTGETKDKDGEKKRFIEDKDCRILFANPQAGGTGVDGLQSAASYCIYFDRSHSAEHYWQSRERIHRGGQTSKVTEIHLVAGNTIDAEILEALERKESFASSVMERIRSKTWATMTTRKALPS